MRRLWLAGILLLAGCSAKPSGIPQPGPEDATASSAEFPGLLVAGHLTNQGSTHRVDAWARNDGPRTYKVTAMCELPWSESWADENGRPVYAREPMAHCLGFRLEDFPPGEVLRFTTWWNETRWNPNEERLEPVPPGSYVWNVVFKARQEAEHDAAASNAAPHAFELVFHVRIE